MGTKNNPGPYNCYKNAEPDEPMFVLLGRDKFAAALVDAWADGRAAEPGEVPHVVAEARACAAAMRAWCEGLGKTPKRLWAPASKPKWLVVSGGDGYQTRLCANDAEMEATRLEFEFGSRTLDEIDDRRRAEELLGFLRDPDNWVESSDLGEDTRVSLSADFEDGYIRIQRV